jgi:signal transduction histidine kinase
VDSLAAWARVARGDAASAQSVGNFDLVELLVEVCGRAALRRHVTLALGEGPLWVWGDRSIVRQALADLCLNARKLTPEAASFCVSRDAGAIVIVSEGNELPTDVSWLISDRGGSAALRARKVPVLAVGLVSARAGLEAQGWKLTLIMEGERGTRLVARVYPVDAGEFPG